MFRVDLSKNRFSEFNLRERDHFQEWLAKQPDVRDEELLIIQKEFGALMKHANAWIFWRSTGTATSL